MSWASSFGAAADAYAEHRPDYAPAAVRWALEYAPGPRVLDLGAGTGRSTGGVTAVPGADVVAVEPDPAMPTTLRRALPDVRALPGSAEAIPLPDASVDWIAGLERAGGSAVIGPRDTFGTWRAATAHLLDPGPDARFGSPEQAEFPHGQRRTADSPVATLATRAGVLVLPERRRAALLGRIRAFLAGRPETADGESTLPMLTGVLRTRRL